MQVAHIDTAAVIAVLHTHLAHAAATSTQPCKLDRAMHINRRAAAAVAALRPCSHPHQALAAALAATITSTRTALNEAVLERQRSCCARAALPPCRHADAAALLQPFVVTMPPPPHHTGAALGAEAKAVQNLGALPELPLKGDMNALHAWVARMKSHGGDREHVALIMHEVEECFHTCALELLHSRRRPPLPSDKLHLLSGVLQAYSEVVQRFETTVSAAVGGGVEGHTAMLQVELRSRETLLVWTMLCLIHRTAATEFHGLVRYALPLQPDDLRHLTLRGRAATSAALVVAAYIQKVRCAADAGAVFSTRDDATLDLAAEYAAQDSFLLEILQSEAELAQARKDEHWRQVLQKQTEVREIQAKANDAHAVVKERQQEMRQAQQGLDAAILSLRERCAAAEQAYQQAQRAARAADALPRPGAVSRAPAAAEHKAEVAAVLARWKEMKVQMKGLQDDRGGGVRATQTPEGRGYIDAKRAVQLAEREVARLLKEMSRAAEPPPRLVQPLPDISVHRRFVLALLFFLFPQHTGALALLRQYTAAAQQCFAAPRPAGSASRHSGRDLAAWAAMYNSAHAACKYGQRPHRAAVEEAAAQLRLFRKLAPLGQLAKQNVMKYHTPEDGVVYPSAEETTLVMVWNGGPISRHAGRLHTDPWQDPLDVTDVSRMYTEQGVYSEWLRVVAEAAPSRLCAAAEPCGQTCCKSHAVVDGPAKGEAARGNLGLTQQDVRPKGMSAEEWQAFARLRAFPLQQMRELCVALHEGDLKLDSPIVRPQSHSSGLRQCTACQICSLRYQDSTRYMRLVGQDTALLPGRTCCAMLRGQGQ